MMTAVNDVNNTLTTVDSALKNANKTVNDANKTVNDAKNKFSALEKSKVDKIAILSTVSDNPSDEKLLSEKYISGKITEIENKVSVIPSTEPETKVVGSFWLVQLNVKHEGILIIRIPSFNKYISKKAGGGLQ